MTPPVSSSAFRELERLVRLLGEELAGFRRRALQAEARVRELEETLAKQDGEPVARERAAARSAGARAARDADEIQPADSPVSGNGDAASLAAENAMLRERLNAATVRTRRMLERMRFLRQQQAQQESAR